MFLDEISVRVGDYKRLNDALEDWFSWRGEEVKKPSDAIMLFLKALKRKDKILLDKIGDIKINEKEANIESKGEEETKSIKLLKSHILNNSKHLILTGKYKADKIKYRFKNFKGFDEKIYTKTYNKLSKFAAMKVNRIKKSTKLEHLKEKYPQVDVVKLASYCALVDKFKLVNEDIEFLDDVMALITAKK